MVLLRAQWLQWFYTFKRLMLRKEFLNIVYLFKSILKIKVVSSLLVVVRSSCGGILVLRIVLIKEIILSSLDRGN